MRELDGLAPDLIVTLAELHGSDPVDLLVTVQLMRWGDRATLRAYGAIDTDGRRVAAVLPRFYELSDAALTDVCQWARRTGYPGNIT